MSVLKSDPKIPKSRDRRPKFSRYRLLHLIQRLIDPSPSTSPAQGEVTAVKIIRRSLALYLYAHGQLNRDMAFSVSMSGTPSKTVKFLTRVEFDTLCQTDRMPEWSDSIASLCPSTCGVCGMLYYSWQILFVYFT